MNRVRDIRVSKGLTQEVFASRLGITQSNLSRIENGEVQMSLNMAIAIAKEGGVTVDELIGRKEENEEKEEA